MNMLIELGLERKLLTITGDNASNNMTMAEVLLESLESRLGIARPLYRGMASYIRCLAHILNLVVQDILSYLKSMTCAQADRVCDKIQRYGFDTNMDQSVLGRLSIFAVWVARSNQRRERWRMACRVRGLSEKFIEQDVVTRWNSTFRMIDDAIRSREQVDNFLHIERDLPAFTDADWDFLGQVALVLGRFERLTSFLSRRRPQMSLVVAVYYQLHDIFNNAVNRKGSFRELHR